MLRRRAAVKELVTVSTKGPGAAEGPRDDVLCQLSVLLAGYSDSSLRVVVVCRSVVVRKDHYSFTSSAVPVDSSFGAPERNWYQ